MPHAPKLCLGGCGSANLQVAVQLAGVGIDDGHSKPLGKVQTQLGLAYGGGPGDNNERLHLMMPRLELSMNEQIYSTSFESGYLALASAMPSFSMPRA